MKVKVKIYKGFFDWFWLYVIGFLLSRVKYNLAVLKALDELLKDGVVVHILPMYSFIDALTLRAYCRRNKLNVPNVVVASFFVRFWHIFKAVWMRLTFRRFFPPPAKMPDASIPGGNYVIFLKRQPSLFEEGAPLLEQEQLKQLVAMQRRQAVPIYLAPHAIFWGRNPERASRGTLYDLIFGDNLSPGRIQKLIIFFRHIYHAFAVTGAPINLKQRLISMPSLDDASAAAAVRAEIFKYFADERAATAGPLYRPRAYVLESILNTKEVSEVVQQRATLENRPVSALREEAAQILETMAADMTAEYISFLDKTLRWGFGKVFSDIRADASEMERLKELRKEGPVVFIPSHKSHVDYLMLSWVLYQYNMHAPLIISGDNLNFWPVGRIFRKSGAIFIRRSFKGDWFYSTILKAYLKKMFWEGYSLEFFIEGSRSRTGKLLQPKLGILSMCADAFIEAPELNVKIIPISFSYEQLIEEKSYERELSGGEKQKEGIKSLLGIQKVLQKRYGAVYMRVAQPLSLAEFAKKEGFAIESLDEKEKRRIIKKFAFQIVASINAVATATPPSVLALAVLSCRARGITQKALEARAEDLLRHLSAMNVNMSPAFFDAGFNFAAYLRLLEKERLIKSELFDDERIYRVEEDGRMRLSFYANNIVHFFLPMAVGATAMLSLKTDRANEGVLKIRGKELSRLLRFEFTFDPDKSYEEVYARTLDFFESQGALNRDGGFVELPAGGEEKLRLFGGMLSALIESYWVCARTLPALLSGAASKKEFVSLCMKQAKKSYLLGEIFSSDAMNKVNIANAVEYFLNRGVLTRELLYENTRVRQIEETIVFNYKQRLKVEKKSVERLALSDDYAGEEKLNVLAGEIKRYFID